MINETNRDEWFRDWFDSPYYGILYSKRDESEAKDFISGIAKFLNLRTRARVLDLACGKGRHSITLHVLGFRVIGIDLSNNSIATAKKSETEGLIFLREDMRNFDLQVKFEAVFNLFTSFGYFENLDENRKVIARVYDHLHPDGLFIIDYLNSTKVLKHLVNEESLERNEIKFNIHRYVQDGIIHKTIAINDNGCPFKFEEKVQALHYSELNSILEESGFKIIHAFGDYQLHDFDEEKSDRVILVAKR